MTEGIIPDMFKTKPNLDRKGSEITNRESLNSSENTSRPASRISARNRAIVQLKDRDWRGKGEREGEMWWECQWEGMDGIGGTNKKGRKCFEKVRITWKF
jgi:hypothetical protein